MHRRMTGTADMDHCRHIQLVQSKLGVLRLLKLALNEQVSWVQKETQKRLVQEMIYFGHIGNKAQLLEAVTHRVFSMSFDLTELPRDEAAYNALKDHGRTYRFIFRVAATIFHAAPLVANSPHRLFFPACNHFFVHFLTQLTRSFL